MNAQPFISNTVMMIEPVSFGFNPETSVNNYFMHDDKTPAAVIQKFALYEFKEMVKLLNDKGIDVIVVKDSIEPHTPDSIFPNNWISFHLNGKVAVYPMFAPNRRAERRGDIIKLVRDKGFKVIEISDYTKYEHQKKFLEGTGSMVLDRKNKTAYATISERTDAELFTLFCRDYGYTPVTFKAYQTAQQQRLPIYHTNVMMQIADQYAVICLECIDDPVDKEIVITSLMKNNKVIIEITEAQMHHFAGNMLQLSNKQGEKYLVMSKTAYDSFTEKQLNLLRTFNEFIIAAIPTIEKHGGGGVRCMMTEIF